MLIIKSDSVDMSTVLKDQTDQVKKITSSTHENWTPEDIDTLNAAKIFLEF